MILKIRKLNMAVLSYDRDALLNVLERTGAAEIKEHADFDGGEPSADEGEELRAYLSRLEAALDILSSAAENSGMPALKDGFAVSYEEFANAGSLKDRADALVYEINSLTDKKNAAGADMAKLARAAEAAEQYAQADLPFDSYADTLHTRVRLGTLPRPAAEELEAQLKDEELAAYDFRKTDDGVLALIVYHISAADRVEGMLSSAGFSACPYTGKLNGAEQLSNIKEQQLAAENEYKSAVGAIAALCDGMRDLKIYCDYVGFGIEKAEASAKCRSTGRTVFMEAFVPEESEAAVRAQLEKAEFPIWYEFSDPAEDEEVPTLLKNNPAVATFETITNTYSPPSHKEFDPNTIMGFFYSLFLGFIMADIGYGVLMTAVGGVLYFRGRKGTGLKSLSGVFAIGGVFAVFWGFLFNSLFGVSVLPQSVMPLAFDLVAENHFDNYTIMGLKIPSVLVIALILGIAQLCAGYVCKAVQEWRRGNVLDGIFQGVTWALFSVGALIAIIGMIEEFALPQTLVTVGGITAGASLAAAALTAGRKEKLLGKFTKGFGSVYGVINYASDILSYARLYGLMLSGAVIAQIVSKYSIDFITGGNVAFAILGVVLMVVGHAFNLAIGLLGAYIHDARLQYVEFYGKFYEGEGELFTPLGSVHRHVYIEK